MANSLKNAAAAGVSQKDVIAVKISGKDCDLRAIIAKVLDLRTAADLYKEGNKEDAAALYKIQTEVDKVAKVVAALYRDYVSTHNRRIERKDDYFKSKGYKLNPFRDMQPLSVKVIAWNLYKAYKAVKENQELHPDNIFDAFYTTYIVFEELVKMQEEQYREDHPEEFIRSDKVYSDFLSIREDIL